MKSKKLLKMLTFIVAIITVIMLLISCTMTSFELKFEVDGEVFYRLNTDGKEVIKLPTNPEKDGYKFGGWYWDKGKWEKPFTANSLLDAPLSSDMTVYAKWNNIDDTDEAYSITFDSDGGSPVGKIEKEKNQTIDIAPISTKDGYTFDGWYDGETKVAFPYTVTANKTLKAKWTINSYTITFATDGSLVGSITKILNETIATSPITTKDGYIFDGWYDGETKVTFPYVITANKTLTAKWTIKSYTITFETDGSSVGSIIKNYNDTIATSPTTTKDGYTFDGWYDGETKVTFPYTVTSNKTLTAKWIINSYTITFATDGSLVGSITKIHNETIATSPITTKDGYIFEGWYDGETKVTFPYVVTANKTLTAKWTINSYTITFETDGSSVGSIIKNYNDTIATSPTTTKDGYTFDGWYDGETKVTFPYTVTANRTLTAKWIDDSDKLISLKELYDKNGENAFKIFAEHLKFVNYNKELIYATKDSTGIALIEFEWLLKNFEELGITGAKSLVINDDLQIYIVEFESIELSKNAFSIYNKLGLPELYKIDKNILYVEMGFYEIFTNNYIVENNSYYTLDKTKLLIADKTAVDFEVPLGTKEIGTFSFYNRTNLEKISIPNSVISIGDNALAWCTNLKSITFAKESQLIYIGSNAFYNCNNLKSITIPSSVTSIGFSAFLDTGIWENALNNEIVYADKWAVGYKGTITTITLRDDTVGICDASFIGCSSITSISIPNSVTNIGFGAFIGCSNLASISVDSDNSIYESNGNCLIEKASKTLILGCNNSIIPTDGSVTCIGVGAFYGCSSLASIAIPNSVTGIGSSAFSGCSSLTSITIPSSVTSIGFNAFYECSSLTIFAAAESEPIGWDNWNPDNRPVVWGTTEVKETYTVSFNTDGGTTVSDIVKEDGGQIISVPLTSKEGYTFDGWYDGANKVTFPYIITANKTFTAEWTINNYTIRFDTAGSYVRSINKNYNESITTAPVTSKDGYTFDGWYDGETKVTFPYTVTANKTLTAKWYLGDMLSFENLWNANKNDLFEIVTSFSNGMFVEYYDKLTLEPFANLDTKTQDFLTDLLGEHVIYIKNILHHPEIKVFPIAIEMTTIFTVNFDIFICYKNILYINMFDLDSVIEVFTGNYKKIDGNYYTLDETKLLNVPNKNITEFIIPDKVTQISDFAFSNCVNLVELTIPSSVTSIGDNVFFNCNKLERIKFEEGFNFTSIGSSPFYGCISLAEIIIPSSVTSIGEGLFSSCSNLTSITFAAGSQLTSIGTYAFYGCSSLRSITIPSRVTSIGASAFEGCSGLKNITFAERSQLASIDSFAFEGCSSLTSLTIPYSITSIGFRAFTGCSGLESITVESGNRKYESKGNCLIETSSKTLILGCKNSIIPTDGSVTSIDSWAFKGCSSLVSITIPSSVTSIGSYAFYGCSGLENITVESGNSKYESKGNCLIETSSKTLKLGCKNSIIPTDGSVTSIGSYAFEGCSSLTSITIPNCVTSIGSDAFRGCSGLTSITFAEGSQLTTIGSSAFEGCSGLSSIIFDVGSQLTSIGSYAFRECSNLTSITIPNSVTSIASGAFSNCSSLTSITIPNNVTSISSFAFEGCSNLASIIIPSSVTSIGYKAFIDCRSLISITVPNNVTSIDFYAFAGCSNLTIYAEAESKPSGWDSDWNPDNRPVVWGTAEVKETYTVTFNADGGTAVSNIVKEDGEQIVSAPSTTKDGYTFDGWFDGETKVTFPYIVTENKTLIAKWFVNSEYFISLKKLYDKNGESALKIFAKHLGLSNDSKELIYADKDSTGEALIEFERVKSIFQKMGIIGIKALVYNDELYIYNIEFESIELSNKAVSIYNGLLLPETYVSDKNILYVDVGFFEIFSDNFIVEDNSYYTLDKTRLLIADNTAVDFEVPLGTKDLGVLSFYNRTNLEKISIPNSVISIGDNALAWCTNLKNITFAKESQLISIGSYAFYNCSSLTSITIPSSVTSIGDAAFFDTGIWNNAENNEIVYADKWAVGYKGTITTITLRSDTVGIGDTAFIGCSSITSLSIPNSVTSIGLGAFLGCCIFDISVDSGNSKYEIKGNCLIEKASKTLILGCNNSIIPTDGSVTNIGYGAFFGCSSLVSISIPKSVTNIGFYAFEGCSSLTSITIPNNVTIIGSGAFSNCSSLKSITIPISVTSIGFDAFYECIRLTIYAEAASLPSGWDSDWNPNDRPVEWNYKK